MLIVALLLADLTGLASLLGTPYDVVAVALFPLLWGLGLVLATAGGLRDERRIAARLFTISFLLRIGVAIAVYRLGLVAILGDEDSSGWSVGWGIAQAWKGDPQFAGFSHSLMQALQRSNQGYYYVAGVLFYLIGAPSRVSLAFLSAFAGGVTTILVYRIAARLFGREAAQKAGVLAAVFPSLVIWSGQTLKEPFVILFECTIVYTVLVLRARASMRTAFLLCAALFCLYTMRFYAAFLSATAVVVVLSWRGQSQGSSRAPLLAGLILSGAVLGLFASGLWQTENERLNQFNLNWIQSFRTNVATGPGGDTGIQLPYDVSTPLGILASFPLSLLAFLLSPFPWQALEGSARLKFAMVDVMLWWWLLPRIMAGVREAWRSRRDAVSQLMLFVLPLMMFYALTFGNGGLAFRERAQILVLLLAFAGLGLILKKPADARDRLRAEPAGYRSGARLVGEQ